MLSYREVFPAMPTLVPEGECEDWKVFHLTLDEEKVRNDSMMATLQGRGWTHAYNYPGTFGVLSYKGEPVMSDTGLERVTNLRVFQQAHGRVLIGGLGLGMIPAAIAQKSEVEKVYVIEKSSEVRRLVAPHIGALSSKIRILPGDVFDFHPRDGLRFNIIYMDIWPTICADNWEDMKLLGKLWRPYLIKKKEDPNRWFGCWMKDYCQEQYHRDRRERY